MTLKPFTSLLLAALLLGGCIHGVPTPTTPAGSLRWPPTNTRIVWEKEFATPTEAGVRKSLWLKVVEQVTGKNDVAINKPYGVHEDEAHRVYVADTGSATVRVFDAENAVSSIVSGIGKTRFRSPVGVTGDGAGRIFISDSAAAAVYVYSADTGEVGTFVTSGLIRPTGIAYSSATKALLVCDTGAHAILAFGPDGREKFRFGGRGVEPGRFNFPTDITVGQDGRIYVTDALNGRIQIFTEDGKPLRAFGKFGDSSGYFAKPKGVAVDQDGHVYVVDALLDTIQVFDQTGRLLLTFGETGTKPGQFWMPSGIFIARDGTIYVSDSFNARIQVFRYLQ